MKSRTRTESAPRVRSVALAIVVSTLAMVATPAAEPVETVVFCAPGYPGSTEQAAPVMRDFAATLERVGGDPVAPLEAEYHETEAGGRDRIGRSDVPVAVVTLPFYLEHRSALSLEPVLEGRAEGGAREAWTLVAKRGTVERAADLSGMAIESVSGYVPAFVRAVLGRWQPIPPDVEIRPVDRLLGALRAAAKGEPIAVLLDAAQAAGLDRLPFAAELEVVVRTPEMPGNLLCTVSGRTSADGALIRAFGALDSTEAGREALDSVRLDAFVAIDPEEIATLERWFDAARETP